MKLPFFFCDASVEGTFYFSGAFNNIELSDTDSVGRDELG